MKYFTYLCLSTLSMFVLGCDKSDSGTPYVDSGSTDVADIPQHIKAFEDESEEGMVQARAMYALVQIGAPAVPSLITALASDNVSVRLMALNTLGLIGPQAKDALPAIKKSLTDPDQNVQNRAKDALEKIGAP